MPRYETVFPIVTSPDLTRLRDFYLTALGAEVEYQFPPEGEPDYLGLRLGDAHLGLGRDPGLAMVSPQRTALWVYTDDCDAAVTAMVAAGATLLGPPAAQPW